MKRFLLRPIAGTEHILYVCLSIPAQLFCKIMIVYLWVNLDTRPNCVVVQNLYWTSVLQDITTYHTSGLIVVFHNFTMPYSIDPVNES